MMQLIGKITGMHGLKGEVSFVHQLKKNTRFQTWDCILIELNKGSYIPFFIETIKPIATDECICKFIEINNRDEAKLVVNKSIYSSLNYSIENKNASSFQQYLGYTIFNDSERIGEIVDAIENKMNNMFLVNHHEKEILIPSQQELISSINHDEKIIYMSLPDGLLDL